MPGPMTGGMPHVKNPEPGFHYRWLDSSQDRLSQHLLGHGDRPGYVIVAGESLDQTRAIAKKLFGAGGQGMVDVLTNRIKYGMSVLGKIPLVEATRRQRERYNDLMDRLGVLDDEYKERTAKRGIKPFVYDEDEMKDRKEFATREGSPKVALTGLKMPAKGKDQNDDGE